MRSFVKMAFMAKPAAAARGGKSRAKNEIIASSLPNNIKSILRNGSGRRGAPTGTGKQKRHPVSNELQSQRRSSRSRRSA